MPWLMRSSTSVVAHVANAVSRTAAAMSVRMSRSVAIQGPSDVIGFVGVGVGSSLRAPAHYRRWGMGFVVAVAVVTGGIAWLSGASLFSAAVSGLFWGAIALGVVAIRDDRRARRERRL